MSTPPEERDWEGEIKQAQVEWMQAIQNRDWPALDALLAEEYVLVSARFGFVDRPRYFEISRQHRLQEFGYDDSKVFLHGDWAVVHSRYREKADWGGGVVDREFYLTDIWIFRDGRWQAVTRHSSIPVPDAAPG